MNKQLKDYFSQFGSETKYKDCVNLVRILEEESGFKPVLRGKIVGFGLYHYQYASGREGEAIVTGFAPQKARISIYIMPGFDDYRKELATLGKHKTAKCCLYINKFSDVDESVLRRIIRRSVAVMRNRYTCTTT